MSARRSLCLAFLAGASLAAASAPSASAHARSALAAKITSVAFKGSKVAPVIEISGHGFGSRPAPNPPKPPVPPYASTYLPGGSGCTANAAPVGLDYGTSLYYASRQLSAGRYRPNLSPVRELDCVGLVITTYTSTRIVVHVGTDYKKHHYTISEGDKFEFAVKTAHFHGVVHYG